MLLPGLLGEQRPKRTIPTFWPQGRSKDSFVGGRKSELIAEIVDYLAVGEIGIKMTSAIENLANHALTPVMQAI